MSAIKPGNPPN
jgi:hypothetical protein